MSERNFGWSPRAVSTEKVQGGEALRHHAAWPHEDLFREQRDLRAALPRILPRPRASGRLPVPRPTHGRAPVRVSGDPAWDQLVAAAGFVSP